MPIIDTMTEQHFKDSATLRDAFSYEAISALFDWYEELSDSLGENIEFDPVAFRCEWCEYHVQDLWDVYSNIFESAGLTESDDADDYDKQLEALKEQTYILDIRRDTHTGGVLVHEF